MPEICSAATASVAVVIPTVNEESTIGAICAALAPLRERGTIHRVLVMDESTDRTAELAAAAGAQVMQQSSVRPDAGPPKGKGDAMWRGLHLVDEDICVFLDGDTRHFDPVVVERLVAAVHSGLSFVKADYDRPWDDGRGTVLDHGGGRVTALTAKPLLRQLFPELAAFGQPLAGELAARTDVLRRLPFVTGYGVDIALLIDAQRLCGREAIGQVRVAPRQNRHRPLHELAPMADVVAATILARAGLAVPPTERPPLTQPVRVLPRSSDDPVALPERSVA